MTPADNARAAVYELKPTDEDRVLGEARRDKRSLPESLLMENELWCCRFRWMVVGVMVLFGTISFFPAVFTQMGFRTRLWWPFAIAGIAGATNIVFLWHAGRLTDAGERSPVGVNLLAQIGVDLVLLTVVVHYTGSVETYISFAYLFHVILACIFFSRGQSLLVTGLAGMLYTGCVWLENAGVIAAKSIYVGAQVRHSIQEQPLGVHLHVFSAVAIWLVVWYLASALSSMVRQRDRELAEANSRLEQAQRERTRHMLRTTHELKAPFSAIMANAQLLLGGYCGELPDKAKEVVSRILNRSERLAAEIQEMLQLANLDSESSDKPQQELVDVAEVVRGAVEQVRDIADESGVSVETNLQSARVVGVEEQLKMLFHNLLSNAVFYSDAGDTVTVETFSAHSTEATAVVKDEGIGIPENKLPSIFEEYYRTNEAVKQHKESTGLGLAIVKRIAQEHGAKMRVESAPGVGTTFTVNFPHVK